MMQLGTPQLPELEKHPGDRNRTSPFAFTGNKFEFRALGSSESPSLPNTVLNTIVAESVERLAGELETATPAASRWRTPRPDRARELVEQAGRVQRRQLLRGVAPEAEKRGLNNLRTTPDALPELVSPQTVGVFEKFGVLSERELEARFEVMTEQYTTQVNIEAETAATIARTQLLPAAMRHLAILQAAGSGNDRRVARGRDRRDDRGADFAIRKLEEKNDHPEELEGLELAKYIRDEVIPEMDGVREVADRLERIVAEDLWPLPRYSEILFIK